jgi:hypothetical protein
VVMQTSDMSASLATFPSTPQATIPSLVFYSPPPTPVPAPALHSSTRVPTCTHTCLRDKVLAAPTSTDQSTEMIGSAPMMLMARTGRLRMTTTSRGPPPRMIPRS